MILANVGLWKSLKLLSIIKSRHKWAYKEHKRPILVEAITVYVTTFFIITFEFYLTILIKCASESIDNRQANIYDGIGYCATLLMYAK